MTAGPSNSDAMTLSNYDVLLKAEVMTAALELPLSESAAAMEVDGEEDEEKKTEESFSLQSFKTPKPSKALREYFANKSSSAVPMHVGNNRFRVMLDEKRPTFLKAWAMEDWKECEDLVRGILDTICVECDPPGRLLVQQPSEQQSPQEKQEGGSEEEKEEEKEEEQEGSNSISNSNSNSSPWKDIGRGAQAQRIVVWLLRAEEDGIAPAPSMTKKFSSVPANLGRQAQHERDEDDFELEENLAEGDGDAACGKDSRRKSRRRRSSAFSFIRFLARRGSSLRRSNASRGSFNMSSLRFSGASFGSFRMSAKPAENTGGVRDSLQEAAMAVASLEDLREQEERGSAAANNCSPPMSARNGLGLGSPAPIAENEVVPPVRTVTPEQPTVKQEEDKDDDDEEEERKRRRSSSHSTNLGKASRRGSVQLPAIRTESINPLDIICTTAGDAFLVDTEANHQQGNNRLQISFNMNRARYESQQTQVVSEIYSLVKSWPGRFVYQDENTGGKWRELPRKEAIEALHASILPMQQPPVAAASAAIPEGPPPPRKAKTSSTPSPPPPPPPPAPIGMPVDIPTTFGNTSGRGSDMNKWRSAEVRNLKERERKKEIASRINRGRTNFGAVQQMFRLNRPKNPDAGAKPMLRPAHLKRGATN